jgi:hypothetical protein
MKRDGVLVMKKGIKALDLGRGMKTHLGLGSRFLGLGL